MHPPRHACKLPAMLLVAGLLGGCTAGGPSYVKTKFEDADQRIVQAADGGYSEFWDVVVPPATPVLTVRAALLADQGIRFALHKPGGSLSTSFAFAAQADVPELTWVELRKPQPGTWRLGIDCGRRCDFAFGFYLKDAVPRIDRTMPTYANATVRLTEETDGASNRINQFRLPPNVTTLSMRVSLATQDAFILSLQDPRDDRRAALVFPGRAFVDDASFLVMDRPPSGTWTFQAECRAGCAYGVGLFVR